MEFPIYTPWENLDAQTIQKVINSGINYRTTIISSSFGKKSISKETSHGFSSQ